MAGNASRNETWVKFEGDGSQREVEFEVTKAKSGGNDTVTVDYSHFQDLLAAQGWSRRLNDDEKVAANKDPEPENPRSAENGPAVGYPEDPTVQ